MTNKIDIFSKGDIVYVKDNKKYNMQMQITGTRGNGSYCIALYDCSSLDEKHHFAFFEHELESVFQHDCRLGINKK